MWSHTVAGVTRPDARQMAHSGSSVSCCRACLPPSSRPVELAIGQLLPALSVCHLAVVLPVACCRGWFNWHQPRGPTPLTLSRLSLDICTVINLDDGMDVLEYWRPHIDWSRFSKGALPEDVWEYFKRVVQLSHAAVHWSGAVDNRRREQFVRPLYPESAYMKRKRKQQHASDVRGLETHQHRAEYLVSDELARLSFLQSVVADQGGAQKLYWAMRYFCPPNYINGRFEVLAFDAFDAEVDLAGDLSDVIHRWGQRG